MNATTIQPSTCYYIPASTLGEMSKPAAEAIDALFNSDLDVSFGDANRTLIDIPHFIQMLEDALDQQGIFYDENDIIHGGFIEIKDAIDLLDQSVYIDLEN